MAFLKVLVLVVVCLVQLGNCNDSDVRVLKDWDTFKTDLKSTSYMLIDFYATWCPHCVNLAPIYEKAAKVLAKSETLKDKVLLSKIECDGVGKKICQANEIQGYPTVKLYHNGKVLDEYMGRRTTDDIVSYMEKVVNTGKAQYLGKKINTHQYMCMAKSYRKYVHKS